MPGPVNSTEGRVLATGIVLPASFEVIVEITPTAVVYDWSEVLRLTTTTTDCCEFGDRLLLVSFVPGTLSLSLWTAAPSGAERSMSNIGYPALEAATL